VVQEDVVMQIDSPMHSSLIEIVMSNGQINRNTEDHPYYVLNKGWSSYTPDLTLDRYSLKVQKLEVGDTCIILTIGKIEYCQIQSISMFEKYQITFNLTKVKRNHNFFANGILVHNKSPGN